MNALILTKTDPLVTMTSREVAELADARHNDVCLTIERLFTKGLLRSSRETRIESTGGRPIAVYDLIERDTYIIMASYSDEVRARIVDRWQELEVKQAAPALALPDFSNPAAAARAWAIQYEASQALAIERDHAIKTKAQIGDKRQATSMAKVAVANREVAKLKDQLGFNTRHATVIAVEGASGKKFGKQDWRPLKAWCKANGASSVTVPCARYGKAQAWPAGAWGAVYGVDLVELFGEVAA